MNPKVDFYFTADKKWSAVIPQLRKIALACGLTEELKWGCPCYVLQQRNIVLIHTFKDYCAFLFFKGALLSDDHGLLVQQTENVQGPRQIRFTNVQELTALVPILTRYIFEAIEVEKAGLKIAPKKHTDYFMVEEFKAQLLLQPRLKVAFEGLTPGRQRAYLLFFAQAKLAKTRVDRIAKCSLQILNGKGLNEN